jgi:hypothetical protein
MKKEVTCFIPMAKIEDLKSSFGSLFNSGVIEKIVVIGKENNVNLAKEEWIASDNLNSTETFHKIAHRTETEYTLLYTKSLPVVLGQFALQRMIQAAIDSNAGMVYSGYYEKKDGNLLAHPVIDYQEGSLRNDFDFGSLLLFQTKALKEAVLQMKQQYQYAGLYDLRLKVSLAHRIFHLPELLYTEVELDTRKSGEKMFDYVDPRNRNVQVEMEQACTDHLKKVGAWLKPVFKSIRFNEGSFENEASVVIPVRNRVKTIGDAITSVLKQVTTFPFNLIVVDNYSTDGTTELIRSFAQKDERVIHVIPERKDLGIGGCWNEAVFHPKCGKFAIQLDSDDLYIDETVVARVVKAFYEQQCAMVVGTYQMVNYNLEEIPPGLIDHREWTPHNGRNNALRINGLGAPRAFYTPVIREVKVPNVSYGEDYALGLNISRHYQIGRIYEPLYLCRRWDENSDASLDIVKMNDHNFYKDKIRTLELIARQQYVKDGQPV